MSDRADGKSDKTKKQEAPKGPLDAFRDLVGQWERGVNQIANEAIAQARRVIGDDYGKDYVPDAPRQYQTKAKNAQEAHEAIRPTDLTRRPRDVARILDSDQARLYELIWLRR